MNLKLDMSKREQIAQFLRNKIRSNEYPSGKRLESVRKLATEFNVSLKIVTDALDDLEDEGLIRREAGRGVFVEQGKKLLFVFIGGDIASPYNYYMPGIDERARERRIKVERLPVTFLRNNADGKSLAAQLKRDYFGVIYDGYFMVGNEPEVKIFHEAGLPVVLPHALTGDNKTTPFLAIHPDFKTAFSDGIRHLREKGHTRIATLTFQSKEGFRGYTRDEYAAFLESLGCEEADRLITFSHYREDAIAEAMRELMSGKKKPTAMICISDFYAMYAIKALHGMGVRIPEDLSVMGFCGYPGGGALEPPLSSVDLLYHEAGRLAVDQICESDRWYGKDAARRIILMPHKIIERKSVGVFGL